MPTSGDLAREAARERVAAEAARRALIDDARGARSAYQMGAILILAGLAIAITASQVPLGLVAQILVGAIGLILIPFGIAVIARAARTIVVSKRRLRELDRQ